MDLATRNNLTILDKKGKDRPRRPKWPHHIATRTCPSGIRIRHAQTLSFLRVYTQTGMLHNECPVSNAKEKPLISCVPGRERIHQHKHQHANTYTHAGLKRRKHVSIPLRQPPLGEDKF